MSDALLRSLLAAVEASPTDVPLRLHVAGLLLDADEPAQALAHCSVALQHDPGHGDALGLLQRATGALTGAPAPVVPVPEGPDAPPKKAGFDWHAAESDLGEIIGPAFVDDAGEPVTAPIAEVERSGLTLADVGGMTDVKARLERSFLAPMKNPDLRKLYGKSLKGGMLLYGPPGCGKTFLARALAGELAAGFISVTLTDVLDMYIGQSEKSLHEYFELARRSAPCVLFLDEIDALGQKRTQTRNSGMRNTVNTLLTEMDSVASDNEGVFVLGATNQPWDVDPALRRPGRFDRTVLVLPPDAPARESILGLHLRDRPLERIDLKKLVKATDAFSGADLAHLCDVAAENAMDDSIRSGEIRPMRQGDFDRALKEVRPSTGAWLASARNVAMFANEDGTYDDLMAYLRSQRMV